LSVLASQDLAVISRRDFVISTTALCIYSLLREARAAIPTSSSIPASRWIGRQDELARGLASGTISQIEWYNATNALAKEVDVDDLSRAIRRASTLSIRTPLGHEPRRRFIAFKGEQGVMVHLPYGVALFEFNSSSVIAPHAHKHMASAHMVIEGKVHVRTFDRIRDEEGALIIRPSSDQIAEVGHAAAMTPEKDNVHWFASRSDRAMTLDVIVEDLDKEQKSYEVQPVDTLNGTVLPDGTIRAPLLSFEQSRKTYSVHA
jgi:hypothetical protein